MIIYYYFTPSKAYKLLNIKIIKFPKFTSSEEIDTGG